MKSLVFAGGGFQGGNVVGSSGELGELHVERPVYPWDLVATMLTMLSIDYDKTYPDRGRSIRVLPFGTGVESGGLLTEIV